MEVVIIVAVIAVILLVVSGVLVVKNETRMGIVALSLGVCVLIGDGAGVRVNLPTGQPAKIGDGIYEVRMVDFYYGNKTEKDSFVLALVLREDGKLGKNPPEYVKIPIDYFADTGDLKKGKEMTIEIQPHKAAKKAVIKK